jgi:hypothetical protein
MSEFEREKWELLSRWLAANAIEAVLDGLPLTAAQFDCLTEQEQSRVVVRMTDREACERIK